mgnify:CR=1 FL=1
MPNTPPPHSLEQLIRMTRVARRKLSAADDFVGGLSLSASATEDEESCDLVDGLRGDDLPQRIVDAGGVPLADGLVGPLDYMARPDADGVWAAAAQAVMTCAWTCSQGPTRAFPYIISEAENALRRARLEAAVPSDELPAILPERALCRDKLRRARYLVDLGLEGRESEDRHAALGRLRDAHRIGL